MVSVIGVDEPRPMIPNAAMSDLRDIDADDDWLAIVCTASGWREKFDITRHAVDPDDADLFAHARRCRSFEPLIAHAARPPSCVACSTLRRSTRRMRRRLAVNARRRRAAPADQPRWQRLPRTERALIDHFCHPCERAYEVPEVRALVDAAGFTVVHMRARARGALAAAAGMARSRRTARPLGALGGLMELVSPARSFSMLLRKA